jgi:hypothetical protein
MTLRPDDIAGVMQKMPMATLRLFADDLPPHIIQGVLSYKPDVAVNRGDPLSKKPGGRAIIAKQGIWFITTEHRNLGESPDKHLAWVVRLAMDHWTELKRQFPNIRADISLLVQDDKFNLHDLPRDLLRKAVEIGELEIEIPAKGQDIVLNQKNLRRELEKLS